MAKDIDANVSATPKIKKVAGNSVLLFIRVLVLAVINLFSVRLMVYSLGRNDYGLYNTLSGVVTISVVIITLFALPLQRFFSFLLGNRDFSKLRETYSASINLLGIFAILIFVLFETVGAYFVSHVLTIPEGRMDVALTALTISVVSFLFSLMQVPFLAMIIANEDMGLYAVISCIDSILKLLCAYLINYSPVDKLLFYVFGLLLVTMVTFSLYAILCITKYRECKYCRVKNKTVYVHLVKFVGWTSLGSISGIGLIQGSVIVLNIYFGPIVNAAFGIANNVYNSLMSLGNSVVVAFRPAMIKSFACNDFRSLNKLFSIGNKLLLLMLISITIPLACEMRYILMLWLGGYDVETLLFCRLFVIMGIIILLGAPISTIVQASGKLKLYYVSSELIMFLHIPLSFFFFHIGMPSFFIFVSMLGVGIISHIIRVSLLKRYVNDFSITWYYLSFIVPSVCVVFLGLGCAYALHTIIDQPILRFLLVFSIVPVFMLLMSLIIVPNKSERQYIIDIVKKMPIIKKCRI